ncbi:Exodeoxyribonuclease VII large subunit [Acidisarcina polymorpha]|uniref:Exodeoxyribonuclease 7 large subunit n=1 Tax=Acidisarcina polymorpha TaxID=2211140 RepID=A0A2Z5G156_9BACT|nr:exodeoxyribonuclease VII large subunit [Acidisarcina polymorpha]AXC12842.1 Exodeoxyribonuclease VII large subunit [Acidisarcina polymorpha]
MTASPQPGQLGFSFEAPKAAPRRIWTVGELVGEVRESIEREYADLWVEGEISNLRSAPSGHVYFTLKDGDSQLPVVLFRRQASLLRFRPEDGLHALVRGKVSVYEQRGQMQLIAEFMEPVGAGSLQIAFEQLKARLQVEGLFDAQRKKPLPAFPHCVGIITSPSGAVIRDFLNVGSRRHEALNVLLYPVVVQGATAAMEVKAGIEYFNRAHTVDVIVIARGGGSLEDLAPFNSELLARAIAASELPVVSAIGHETDFTIADFTADLRAPTPSAAAELITEAQHKVAGYVETMWHRLQRACRFQLIQSRERFSRVQIDASSASLRDAFGRRQQRIDELRFRMEAAWRAKVRQSSDHVNSCTLRLLRQDTSHRLRLLQERLAALDARLAHTSRVRFQSGRTQLKSFDDRLAGLSPLAVLNRGYALVYGESGNLIRTSDAAHEGESITTRLAYGTLKSRVFAIERSTDTSS